MSGRADRVTGSIAAAPFAGFPEHGRIVVFDLEITAWEGSLARNWSGPGEYMEVVQIGAVKLDAAMPMAELDSFEILVQPEKNPVLSEYFTALTGIGNADLEREAVGFAEALSLFATFVGDARAVLSNGADWSDLVQNAEWVGMDWPFAAGLFSNIRPDIAQALGVPNREAVSSGLPARLGLEEVAGAHTGLGDSRAIAAALRQLRIDGRL
ncbi:exonuclease domain-containing protein [Nisaea sp.]|uniref:exonuclease domain-containing protein n=1 Tax=Nisaea sp. TaxID=2024842 RepID=UPI003B527D7B